MSGLYGIGIDAEGVRRPRVHALGAAAHFADHRVAAGARHATCTSTVGGPGVGAVGMCFSGGFALGMMVDDIDGRAGAQPALAAVRRRARRRGSADLNLSPADAARVAERAAEGCEVLGLRFTEDKLVGTRFDSLRTLLGDAFIAVELP